MLYTDCLILGGGLAGWMAARKTVKAGMDTLIVHDGMGASPWVHGFNAPVRKGDNAGVFLQDTLKSGQGLSDPLLAEALCTDAGEIFKDLQNLGLEFNRDGEEYQALRPLGSTYPRVVSIGNETGAAVLRRLRQLLDGKVHELPHSRALRLLGQQGRVCGALVYNTAKKEWTIISAKAVILACGGFCGIYPVSTNKRDSGGDGIAMAYEIGAKLCDLEFIQFEPSAAVWPKELVGTSMITTLFFEGAVLRNRHGERFMLKYDEAGERVGKDVLARCISAEIACGNGTEHGGVYMDITGVDAELLNSRYAMYVKRYADVGIDITKEWIELAPAPHTALGGVTITPECRTTVSGLFACGEVIGGLHGANRVGGNAGLETLVFGRRAGFSAADYAAKQEQLTPSCPIPVCAGESIAETLNYLRSRMQEALWNHLGPARSGKGLLDAIGTLQECLEKVRTLQGASSEENFLRLRLENDLTAAWLTANSAYARDNSVGCHSRSDCPGAEIPPLRTTLQKGYDVTVLIRKESV